MIVSPEVDLAPFRMPTGEPTPARRLAQRLADTMRPSEVRRFDRALQNIEGGADRFCRSTISPAPTRPYARLTLADMTSAEHVLIVYADAAKNGCFGVVNPPVALLAALMEKAERLDEARRRKRLIGHVVRLLPHSRPDEDNVVDVATDILEVAALVTSRRDLRKLREVWGGVPAIAIAARSDTRGKPNVEIRHVVSRYPGEYLGTVRAAGRG